MNTSQPSASQPNVRPPQLLFCFQIPEFAAQALVRLRPALHRTAVVVLEGDPPLERSCAATLQARKLGVLHGMTRTEVESFPHLSVLRRSPSEEASTVQALLEMAASFTPSVQELPRSLAFTLALNMTGCSRYFGTPQAIGHKLLRAARDLGLSARVAASANLQAAACLLRAPGPSVIVVPPGEERTYLQHLPLAALELTEDFADTFTAWGLRTAGELAALPDADLVARLGQPGHRLQRLARGTEPHLLVPVEPAFTLREYLAFDAPVDNLESLLFVLGPMLDQLIHRARSRALLLASLTVTLHLERSEDAADKDLAIVEGKEKAPSTSLSTAGPQSISSELENRHDPQNQKGTLDSTQPTHRRTLKPALPLDDRTLLLKLLQLDLQAHPSPAAVVAITLGAEPGPRPGVQSGLFAPQLPDPMRLEVTVARIRALVGEDRVGRAVLTDSHAPEAFRMDQLTFNETMERRTRRLGAPLPLTQATPHTGVALRRLRPPRNVEVRHDHGRLVAFTVREGATPPLRYTVQKAFGPWRNSGHWWSADTWSREEWDIAATTSDGNHLLCLLTHNLLQTRWQMEALYD